MRYFENNQNLVTSKNIQLKDWVSTLEYLIQTENLKKNYKKFILEISLYYDLMWDVSEREVLEPAYEYFCNEAKKEGRIFIKVDDEIKAKL